MVVVEGEAVDGQVVEEGEEVEAAAVRSKEGSDCVKGKLTLSTGFTGSNSAPMGNRRW